LCANSYTKRSFYQGRLGKHIGKALKKEAVFLTGWASSMTFNSFQPHAKRVTWRGGLARRGFPHQVRKRGTKYPRFSSKNDRFTKTGSRQA
jgi:hypothetical protein